MIVLIDRNSPKGLHIYNCRVLIHYDILNIKKNSICCYYALFANLVKYIYSKLSF
jgi:hypothetical protein